MTFVGDSSRFCQPSRSGITGVSAQRCHHGGHADVERVADPSRDLVATQFMLALALAPQPVRSAFSEPLESMPTVLGPVARAIRQYSWDVDPGDAIEMAEMRVLLMLPSVAVPR